MIEIAGGQTPLQEMGTKQLIRECIWYDREVRRVRAALNRCKAELQGRAAAEMEDHNVKYVKYYADAGAVAVADSQSLDVLNPEKLRGLVGEGLWDAKVSVTAETKYKYDPKFERMLKAIFTGDYTFEITLEEFLDEMSVRPDARQKKTLLKKLKGDFAKDKETLEAVLGQAAREAAGDGREPDWDVELWYIYRIKNGELIRAFLPEEFLDDTIAAIRKAVMVESKTAVTLEYDKDGGGE